MQSQSEMLAEGEDDRQEVTSRLATAQETLDYCFVFYVLDLNDSFSRPTESKNTATWGCYNIWVFNNIYTYIYIYLSILRRTYDCA